MSFTFIEEIREWLDTETRAILCAEPPTKLTAVGTGSYSLLLVRQGKDVRRTEDVVIAIQQCNPILLVDYPFVVAQEMTLDEALAGQFALACCDCISAFVPDGVVCDSDRSYLQQVNEQVTKSPEFELIHVTLTHIPHTEAGRRFCWQFLGLATGLAVPTLVDVFRKKARLMEHWARRSGVELRVDDPQEPRLPSE